MLNIAQTLADTPKNHYLYTTKHTCIYRLLPLSPLLYETPWFTTHWIIEILKARQFFALSDYFHNFVADSARPAWIGPTLFYTISLIVNLLYQSFDKN